jgi:hypothetical protein
MLGMLAGNITRLQDSFMEKLYADLETIDADLSSKLTLRLNDQALLSVAGEHPDREAIQSLLCLHPEFSAALTEIATQSVALRNLRSLRALASSASSASGYAVLSSRPGENAYQVSLKGDMNHFYWR